MDKKIKQLTCVANYMRHRYNPFDRFKITRKSLFSLSKNHWILFFSFL